MQKLRIRISFVLQFILAYVPFSAFQQVRPKETVFIMSLTPITHAQWKTVERQLAWKNKNVSVPRLNSKVEFILACGLNAHFWHLAKTGGLVSDGLMVFLLPFSFVVYTYMVYCMQSALKCFNYRTKCTIYTTPKDISSAFVTRLFIYICDLRQTAWFDAVLLRHM